VEAKINTKNNQTWREKRGSIRKTPRKNKEKKTLPDLDGGHNIEKKRNPEK